MTVATTERVQTTTVVKDPIQVLCEWTGAFYWVADIGGRVVRVIHRDPRLMSAASRRFVGRTPWQSGFRPTGQSWHDVLDRFIAGVVDSTIRLRRAEPDGASTIIDIQGRPVVDDSGETIGFDGIARDVTEEAWLDQLDRILAVDKRIDSGGSVESVVREWMTNISRAMGWPAGRFLSLAKYRKRESFTEYAPMEPGGAELPDRHDLKRLLRDDPLLHRVVREQCVLYEPKRSDSQTRFLSSHGRLMLPLLNFEKLVGVIEFRDACLPPETTALTRSLMHLSERIATTLDRQGLRRLQEGIDLYASTVEMAAIGICHVDRDGIIMHANRRLACMLGLDARDLIGRSVADLSHPDDKHLTDTLVRELAAGKRDSFVVEKRYRLADERTIWVRINSTMKWSRDGQPKYHISTVEDVSARKEAEERVQYLATHDELTGLPNRAMFGELLDRALHAHKRDPERNLALLFIDLDRFKVINDSLGHAAGDELLQIVVKRIRGCLRSGDAMARQGGDEFVVLLDGVEDTEQARRVAQKLIAAAHEPVTIGEREVQVSISVGIAACPEHGVDATTLMRCADTAMYSAKEKGRNCYDVYGPDTTVISVAQMTLEAQLRHALEREEFSIQYQPVVDASTGRLIGAEALIRWWNREFGTISPSQFIPVAEETGQIVDIDDWVLARVCEQSAAWHQAGLRPVKISINISPRRFCDSRLPGSLQEAIKTAGVQPDWLDLELSDRFMLTDIDKVIPVMALLRRMGVGLTIDDFGSAPWSLTQLRQLPVDTLKIDRSFIRDLPYSDKDAGIVTAIIPMGHSIGAKVIAKGVTSPAQLDFLVAHGCDGLQGYYVGKATQPDAIARMVKEEVGKPAASRASGAGRNRPY